jgi:hypothetical protein
MNDRRLPARTDAVGSTVARWIAVVAVATGISLAACVDESHDLEVQALGGESPGVPRGPLHRPGQPCLVCHGEPGPASHKFVMAGTVYAVQGQSAPAPGVQVVIEDVNGNFYGISTNEAGNFYITTAEWSPTLPAQVQISKGTSSQQMLTHIGRDGSCADCHTPTPGPTSPGPVYLALAPLPPSGP